MIYDNHMNFTVTVPDFIKLHTCELHFNKVIYSGTIVYCNHSNVWIPLYLCVIAYIVVLRCNTVYIVHLKYIMSGTVLIITVLGPILAYRILVQWHHYFGEKCDWA